MEEKVNIQSVEKLLNELGLHDFQLLAVAKGKNRNAGEDEKCIIKERVIF